MEAAVSPLYKKARTAWLMDLSLQSSLIIPRLLLCKKDMEEGNKSEPTRQMVKPLAKDRRSKSDSSKSQVENKNKSIPLGVTTLLISFSVMNSSRTSEMWKSPRGHAIS